jgi:hypothetical protein
MNDEEAEKLLDLFHNPQTEEATNREKLEIAWRVWMKAMGAGWAPEWGPEPEEHKRQRERSTRLSQLHPLTTTTEEQNAERQKILEEIETEAIAEFKNEGFAHMLLENDADTEAAERRAWVADDYESEEQKQDPQSGEPK